MVVTFRPLSVNTEENNGNHSHNIEYLSRVSSGFYLWNKIEAMYRKANAQDVSVNGKKEGDCCQF